MIDIQISLASLEPRDRLLSDMQILGYTHVNIGDGFDLIYPLSVAEEYLSLKRELARVYGGATAESRESYALGKSDFVERVLVRAFAEGLPEFGCSDG